MLNFLIDIYSPAFCSQRMEWQALSIVHGLSNQLRAACSNVVSSAQGLPRTVQDQLNSAKQSAEELYSSFGSTSTITPVIMEQSRHHLTKVLIALQISILFWYIILAKCRYFYCLNFYLGLC